MITFWILVYCSYWRSPSYSWEAPGGTGGTCETKNFEVYASTVDLTTKWNALSETQKAHSRVFNGTEYVVSAIYDIKNLGGSK